MDKKSKVKIHIKRRILFLFIGCDNLLNKYECDESRKRQKAGPIKEGSID
jgi:hypothetical protein